MIYILMIIWIAYAIIEGKREAIFWHILTNTLDYNVPKMNYDPLDGKDLHPLFALQRGAVLLILAIATYYIWDSFWLSGYTFIMNCLIFSFFHNGMMYHQRYKMSIKMAPSDPSWWVYKKGWWDQSTTSTAWSTKFMTPISRTIQAVLGIIGYILIFFVN
jgi:hypothetical protein